MVGILKRLGVTLVLVLTGLSTVAANASAGPGDLDPSFSEDGRVAVPDLPPADAVAVGADGSVYTAGAATLTRGNWPTTALPRLSRFTAAGDLDLTFGGGGSVELPLAQNYAEFEAKPYAIRVLVDGSVLVAVVVDNAKRFPSYERRVTIVRLTADGHIDQGFGTAGVVDLPVRPESTAIDSQGRVIYAAENRIWRLTSHGAPDSSFSGDGSSPLPGEFVESPMLATGPDDSIAAAATTPNPGDHPVFGVVARFLDDGTLDPAFAGDGVSDESLAIESDLEVALDGTIHVLVDFEPVITSFSNLLGRFDVDGQQVPFASGLTGPLQGWLNVDTFPRPFHFDQATRSIAVDSHDGIYLFGYSDGLSVRALTADGQPSDSWGRSGENHVFFGLSPVGQGAAALAPDGSVVLAGGTYDFMNGSYSSRGLALAKLQVGGLPTDDVDLDGLADAADRCRWVAPNEHSGCPVAAREVTARRSGPNELAGRVRTNSTSCYGGLRLFRVLPGRDHKIPGHPIRFDRDPIGRWTASELRKGRYYVSATAATVYGRAYCPASRTSPVRLRG
jgi:uncharacterized delta-60 repeat protein